MGCDGGTIPKRDELVKTKKKPEQKDKTSELSFRWQHCALSQAPLNVPVVACELGRMYSKESIIETLIEKASAPVVAAPVPEPSTSSASTVVSHIRSTKDIKTLNLTQNPDWAQTTEVGDGYIDNNKSQWMCPVSGHSLNGKFRFVFPWTCGCVFSEKALEMITKGSKDKDKESYECLKCQKPFQIGDIVVLNPTEETEIESLRTKMELRRAAAKAKKSSKSAQKNGETASTSTATSTTASKNDIEKKNGESSNSKGEKKRIQNGESSSSTSKKTKLEPPVSKISGAYSVAKDPRASDTFKSLFTSSEKAKAQDKAHWVTYNPFYN